MRSRVSRVEVRWGMSSRRTKRGTIETSPPETSTHASEVPGLGLDVLVETLDTGLTPESRLLETAEGSLRGARVPVVDAHHPELELLAHFEGGRQVAGVDIGGQPVIGGMGEGDGVIDVTEGDDRHDRAEDLLFVDGHARLHVGEDGGLIEVAGCPQPAAPGEDSSPLVDTGRDEIG